MNVAVVRHPIGIFLAGLVFDRFTAPGIPSPNNLCECHCPEASYSSHIGWFIAEIGGRRGCKRWEELAGSSALSSLPESMDLLDRWERCDAHGRYTQLALPRSALGLTGEADYVHAVIVADRDGGGCLCLPILSIPSAQLKVATDLNYTGVLGPHRVIKPRMM
eukprot:6471668-Amphidinium_carterae.1